MVKSKNIDSTSLFSDFDLIHLVAEWDARLRPEQENKGGSHIYITSRPRQKGKPS